MNTPDIQGDETVSLSDVLVARDACLPEDELWALCRECCLVLEVVNNSPDMFQTLCVTPDTVAFDQVGNVCFLDLDVDPEPIYLAPEYSKNGNSYKAHLFSLGMTLLYAAEYNVDHTKETVSAELRDLLGHMTADDTASRPDLESTIILCEEQLCGQSSQEVCCGIAAVVGFGLPQEDNFEDNTLATASYATDIGVSPDADSFMQSEQADATYCDDIPDLTEDISQVESLPSEQETLFSEQETVLSEQETVLSEQETLFSEQGTIIVTETTESHDDSLPLSEEQEMNRKQRKTSSSNSGLNDRDSAKQNRSSNVSNMNNKSKPALPKKPDINFNVTEKKSNGVSNQLKKVQDGELIVSELFSESESDQSRRDSDKSMQEKKQKLANGLVGEEKLSKTDSKSKDANSSGSNSNKKEVTRDSNQNITYLKYEDKGNKEVKNFSQTGSSKNHSADLAAHSKDKTDLTSENGGTRNRRNKRKQGLTVSDILDALERNLTEAELWALCKEGTAALQRKKKHLPAYLSPDTLVIRESGNVSFKAIPEEKPLEVIFMAPELQKKGELSEKTCLFGLSVTLRCAAGKKYSSVSSINVSSDLKDLLQYLADSNPVKRPELVDIAKVCNEHGNGTSSDSVCAKLFQEAYATLNEKEEAKQKQQAEAVSKSETSQSAPSAFKPAGGSSFQPVKPVPVGGASGGAFCPVPKKSSPNKENAISEPRIPSAFSSPATHFKPIILQQTSANEKPSTVQEEKTSVAKEKPSTKSSSQSAQKKVSPDPNADKEKEVVKKLKELKKNLMKHKQPSMAKEIENEDKVSDQSKESTSKSSTPNKKSLPPTPKKSSSRSGERSGKRRASSGALDALLKEIQKQGNVPDTHSLASAIAGFLQNHLNQGESNTKTENQPKSTGDLDMTVTSAQASLGQGHTLQNLNIPSQYHSQLLGQTMTLPGMQYGGNIYPGLPQFQFQQDPVTGYLQLVPVVPMRPQSVHSNSGSVHSARDFTSPTGSGSALKDINSPEMSPKTYHNQSDLSNQSAISDPSGSRTKVPHGRTAKDLVQKTANMRAKNLGRPSPSNLLNVPRETSGLYKWKSDHALDRFEPQFYSDSERFHKHNSYSSLSFSNKLTTGFVYDDSMLNANSYRSAQMTGFSRSNGAPHYRSPDDMHRPNLNSTASSPSPSTHDSGIAGMNHGVFRGNMPGSDSTLMDRLLNSNGSGKQQRILGKIVHLLREEFAFDGYMENGVEDLAMAEYIASLGVLKWETFKSAISEKYSDIYWHDELLKNLYTAVNSGRPPSGNRGNTGHGRGPATHRQQRQAGNQEDDSSGLSETNESSRRLQPQLSPLHGQQGHQRSKGNKENQHVDTSDSTDTENYGKRRRIKTKHELDRMKSSSNSNLLVENSQTSNGNVTNVPSNNASVSNSNHQSSSHVNLPQPTVNRQHSVDSIVPSSQNSQNLQKTANLSSSCDSPRIQSLKQDSSIGGVSNSKSDVSQNDTAINGIPSPQRANGKPVRLSREVSLSSHSSSQSDLVKEGEGAAIEKRGHVVYHWAMIQLCMSQEMERFMQDVDEQNSKMLLTKLSALSQEIKMEKRSRRRTQKFYKSLVDSSKNNVFEVAKNDKAAKAEKNQLLQVAKDITEMTKRIVFVDLCKTHLQMLLAELQGIDISYLYSIAMCAPGEPLQLQPRPDNPLLQFQTLREPHTGCEIQALHAGTPEGLMAYLFASTALSDGYIHQFLFCYRYFTTAMEVMTFLINKFASATKSGSTETNISRLKQRTVDLLHYWLEGYYSIDFKGKSALISLLRSFIREHVGDDSEGGESLLALLSNCCSDNNLELSSADPDEAEIHFWQTSVPKVKQPRNEKKKEWESFKSLVRGKSNSKDKGGKVTISAVCVERRRRSTENPDTLHLQRARRTDAFMLADYTPQCLAEQLCLIEQGIFQLTHPVHYLDSKSCGVGVALTMKGMKTPAMARRSATEESLGLLIEPLHDSTAIQKMIDHAQEVSHWVSGEIVACSNPKTQIAVLSKFLFIAHACVELRNFATSMAILDGLENLIVKQLPAWKSLPQKCTAVMDELLASRMFLKNDPLSLMQQGKDCHLYPTIPSAVIFLLHIQQLEIGGFRLANQMYKWGKMRSICQVIDQIRIYREHMYGFEADHSLQDTLRQRIHEMSDQDIHDLAAQHDINYQKMSSGSGISGAFRKMKGKFQAK